MSDKRMSISLPKMLDDEIEKFRYENRDRLPTKNKAINELLQTGVEALKEETENKKAPPTELQVGEAMDLLLRARYKRDATPGELELFATVLPLLCDGIKDKA